MQKWSNPNLGQSLEVHHSVLSKLLTAWQKRYIMNNFVFTRDSLCLFSQYNFTPRRHRAFVFQPQNTRQGTKMNQHRLWPPPGVCRHELSRGCSKHCFILPIILWYDNNSSPRTSKPALKKLLSPRVCHWSTDFASLSSSFVLYICHNQSSSQQCYPIQKLWVDIILVLYFGGIFFQSSSLLAHLLNCLYFQRK